MIIQQIYLRIECKPNLVNPKLKPSHLSVMIIHPSRCTENNLFVVAWMTRQTWIHFDLLKLEEG